MIWAVYCVTILSLLVATHVTNDLRYAGVASLVMVAAMPAAFGKRGSR